MTRILHFVLCISVAGVTACGAKAAPTLVPEKEIVKVYEAIEVAVPIPVKAKLPPELLAALPVLPRFVTLSDPAATVALTPEGVEQLLKFIREAFARLAGTKAYDEAP